MSSPCGPEHAAVGDVGTALMMVDSRLKSIYDRNQQNDAEQRALNDQLIASMGPGDADDVLDGACTLIYMFMQWLRRAYEEHDKDVIECVVPNLVGTMRVMTRSIRPETIPTMTGLLVAAALDLSPNLWRKQYGYWTKEEMNPLEATAFLLAEHINRITDDRDFATRIITDALTRVDEG
ncbi:hypothetical protein [Streptomyces sp. NPDC059080]|uniref:hypothetical protein n=1 Tax=Streptomyces sp. NPDC059080 TaxID=3346718 RepID=UPI0036A16128